jgi:hypothetical protein
VKATLRYSFGRPGGEEVAADDKRICSPDYFSIYIRAGVPEEMFSNADLEGMVLELNAAETESQVDSVLRDVVLSLPSEHPKREDAFWKLSRGVHKLTDAAAEQLAFATARCASDYSYGILHTGEGSRALNLVFAIAQKLSTTAVAQRVLEGSIADSSDDTFALKLWQFTENPSRNKILTNLSNISATAIKRAFIKRMRERYGPTVDVQSVNLKQADWLAFGVWLDESMEDRRCERKFWQRFIGQSRKRLAQAINFIYPRGVAWIEDPTPAVEKFFPSERLNNC